MMPAAYLNKRQRRTFQREWKPVRFGIPTGFTAAGHSSGRPVDGVARSVDLDDHLDLHRDLERQ